MSYYAVKSDGSKETWSGGKLPEGGYFLSGYHDKNEAGMLYVSVLDVRGTTLMPLYHPSGKTVKMPQYAGKEVREVGGSDKISKEIDSGKFFGSKVSESKKLSRLPTLEGYVADKPMYNVNEAKYEFSVKTRKPEIGHWDDHTNRKTAVDVTVDGKTYTIDSYYSTDNEGGYDDLENLPQKYHKDFENFNWSYDEQYTSMYESTDPEIQSLPKEYDQSGMVMKQIDRSEKAAFYGDEGSDTYEVFLVRIADAITDTSGEEPLEVPAREMIPTDDDFGTDAWSFTDRSAALEKFNEFK